MRKVVIAYHSVAGPNCPAAVGSFPISLDRFAAQIDGIVAKGWRVLPLSQLGQPCERDSVYITGDDGTADWARNVLPWCEERSIPTQTAIITGVWRDEPIYPIAHKVQVLLAVRKPSDLPRPTLTAQQVAYIDKIYAYETDPARRYLKGACNIFLDYDQANELIGTLDFDCLKLLAERFARPEEYRRFRHAQFGVHTVTHAAYGGDAEGYFRAQVYPCLQMLFNRLDNVGRFFTLPVKPKDGVSLEPLNDILRRHGFAGMLTHAGEWDQTSFVVTRIDAKDVESFFNLPKQND